MDEARAAALARAVAVETGPCGAADPGRGSGVALAPDRILTVAHVVASGGPIEVTTADGSRPADLVRYDPQRDLALLAPLPSLGATPSTPSLLDLDPGTPATIVGAATSGDIDTTVLDLTIIEMDDVRLTTRSTRRGYLVEATTAPGDSGSGLYDQAGNLAGLLFAVSTTGADRSWVTAASEIEAFLIDPSVAGTFTCDPERSRVTRTD